MAYHVKAITNKFYSKMFLRPNKITTREGVIIKRNSMSDNPDNPDIPVDPIDPDVPDVPEVSLPAKTVRLKFSKIDFDPTVDYPSDCPSCDGIGKPKCYYCSGKGKQSCNTCRGTGLGDMCSTCNGYGYIGYSTCTICNGVGFTGGTCSTCSGTGITNDDCTYCNGTGLQDYTCYTCSGSGKFGAAFNENVIITKVEGTESTYDFYYDSTDWSLLFKGLCLYNVPNSFGNILKTAFSEGNKGTYEVIGANLAGVTNISGMFSASGITKCCALNTTDVTNFSGLFGSCYIMKNVATIDFTNATDVSQLMIYTINMESDVLPIYNSLKDKNVIYNVYNYGPFSYCGYDTAKTFNNTVIENAIYNIPEDWGGLMKPTFDKTIEGYWYNANRKEVIQFIDATTEMVNYAAKYDEENVKYLLRESNRTSATQDSSIAYDISSVVITGTNPYGGTYTVSYEMTSNDTLNYVTGSTTTPYIRIQNVEIIDSCLLDMDNIIFWISPNINRANPIDTENVICISSNLPVKKGTYTYTDIDGNEQELVYDLDYYTDMLYPGCGCSVSYHVDNDDFEMYISNGLCTTSNNFMLLDGNTHIVYFTITCDFDGETKTISQTVYFEPEKLYGKATELEVISDGTIKIARDNTSALVQINDDTYCQLLTLNASTKIDSNYLWNTKIIPVTTGDIVKIYTTNKSESCYIQTEDTTAQLKIKRFSSNITELHSNFCNNFEKTHNGGIVEIDSWDGFVGTSIYAAFNGCKTLTKIPSTWNLPNVINAELAFQDCYNLTTIPDTFEGLEKLENAESMFRINASNYDEMGIYGIKKVTSWVGLNSIKNAEQMFYASSVKIIPLTWTPLASIEIMRDMFANCTNLEVCGSAPEDIRTDASQLRNIVNVSNIFSNCINVRGIYDFYLGVKDQPNLTSYSYAFSNAGINAAGDERLLIPIAWGGDREN